MNLFPTDEPSGCVISDTCNFLLSIGIMEETNPFDEYQTIEDFSMVMSDVVQSFAVVNDNMDILTATLDTEDLMTLLVAMNRINDAAKEVMQQRNF